MTNDVVAFDIYNNKKQDKCDYQIKHKGHSAIITCVYIHATKIQLFIKLEIYTTNGVVGIDINKNENKYGCQLQPVSYS